MDIKFNFSSKFKVANIFSLILFTASILFILFKGLNYGIDFKGGTLIELRANNIGASEIRSVLNNMNLGDVNVKKFGKEGDYLIKVEQKENDGNNIIPKIKETLSNNLKVNIIKESAQIKKLSTSISLKTARINSKEVVKNDIFFAIKGKRFDGNKYANEAIKKGASLSIIDKDFKTKNKRKIKVKNSLNFLTKCSKSIREISSINAISITGSSGKTSLKELLGYTLNQISSATFSKKSFNNKYGVPLSLFNLKKDDEFGVFEVGMDKKGEIDNLTKIIKPDVGIITNISYAHSKNFRNIRQIAEAKAEIMNNIKSNGTIILNRDDNFYNYHKDIALNKKLKIISFGIRNKSSEVKLLKVKKIKNRYELFFNISGKLISLYSKTANKSNLYNILATLASINLYLNVYKLKKDIFLNLKIQTRCH